MYSNPTDFISIQELLDSSRPYVPLEEFGNHLTYLSAPQNHSPSNPILQGHDIWRKTRADIWEDAIKTAFVASAYKAKFINIRRRNEPLIWYSWHDNYFPEIAEEEIIERALSYLKSLANRYHDFIRSMEAREIDLRIFAPKNWNNTSSPIDSRDRNLLRQIGFEKSSAHRLLRELEIPSTLNDLIEGPLDQTAASNFHSDDKKSIPTTPETDDPPLISPIKLITSPKDAIDIRINAALRNIELGDRERISLSEIKSKVWTELTKAPISLPFTHYDPKIGALRIAETEAKQRDAKLDKEALHKRLRRRLEKISP